MPSDDDSLKCAMPFVGKHYFVTATYFSYLIRMYIQFYKFSASDEIIYIF